MNDVVVAERPTKLGKFISEVLPPAKRDEIRRALPAHVPIDRFERNLSNAVMNQPKLLDCNPAEVFREVAKIAALGLVMDSQLGEAYLIASATGPQARIGYRGLIKLARQSGDISAIYAHEVYSKDDIECVLGDDKRLVHKPDIFGERGDVVGFYAVMKFKDGDTDWEPMNLSQINEIRDKSDGYRAFKAGKIKSTPWHDAYNEMAKKTVLRRLLKRAPMSPDLADAVRMEDEAEHSEYIRDAAPPPPPPRVRKEAAPKQIEGKVVDEEGVDPETGEVIETEKEFAKDKPKAEAKKEPEKKDEPTFDYASFRKRIADDMAAATTSEQLLAIWNDKAFKAASLLSAAQKADLSDLYGSHEDRIQKAAKAASKEEPKSDPVAEVKAALEAAKSEEEATNIYESVVIVAREEGTLSADQVREIDDVLAKVQAAFAAPPAPAKSSLPPEGPERDEMLSRARKRGKLAAAGGKPRKVPDDFADPELTKEFLAGYDSQPKTD